MLAGIVLTLLGVLDSVAGWFVHRASTAKDRDREAREAADMEAHLVTADFLAEQRRRARMDQTERDRVIDARVKDPAAPTRAEVDAAMDREEREP